MGSRPPEERLSRETVSTVVLLYKKKGDIKRPPFFQDGRSLALLGALFGGLLGDFGDLLLGDLLLSDLLLSGLFYGLLGHFFLGHFLRRLFRCLFRHSSS